MWPIPNPLDLFGDAAAGVVGWAWDSVIQGVYTWFADGVMLMIENDGLIWPHFGGVALV
jgi:hypothetical protein